MYQVTFARLFAVTLVSLAVLTSTSSGAGMLGGGKRDANQSAGNTGGAAIDETHSYLLTSDKGNALTASKDGVVNMGKTSQKAEPDQLWKLVPVKGKPGFFLLANNATAEEQFLTVDDGAPDGADQSSKKKKGNKKKNKKGNVAGGLSLESLSEGEDLSQYWKLVQDSSNPGFYVITNAAMGDKLALDGSSSAPAFVESKKASKKGYGLWKLADQGGSQVGPAQTTITSNNSSTTQPGATALTAGTAAAATAATATSANAVSGSNQGGPNTDTYYSLSNMFVKDALVLAVGDGGKLGMANTAQNNDPTQLWKFTPVAGQPGYYRISNASLGDGKSIDSSPDAPHIAATGNYSGQIWKIVPAGNGYYRFSNMYQPNKSLDTYNNQDKTPFLGNTGNFSGQFWKLTAKANVKDPLPVATTTTTATTPSALPAGMVKVKFKNGGNTKVTVTPGKDRKGNKITGRDPIVIAGGDNEMIPLNIGDSFDVGIEALNGQNYAYPRIFVWTTDDIYIVGNPPAGQITSLATQLQLSDYSTNYYGYDIKDYNRSNPAGNLKSLKIFEGFDYNNSVDYETNTGPLIMKAGFIYSGNVKGAGDSNTHMSAGYTSFSKQWGASLSGSGPLGKLPAQVSASIAVKDVEQEERSEENIFVFSRQQKTLYDILVDPKKARLDEGFKSLVRNIKSAADAKGVVDTFGTHFNTKVTYGGDRWFYSVISREQYSKFKSFGIDVKAGVSTSGKKQKVSDKDKDGNDRVTTSSRGKDISAEASVSYSEERKQGKSVEDVTIKYRYLGGDGDFDGWNVSIDNAMPVAFESDTLDKLIDITIFRDESDPEQLKRAKAYVAAEIQNRINNVAKLGPPKPAPKVYKVKLDRLEVTDEIDDANKNTKGSVKVGMVQTNSLPVPFMQGGKLYPDAAAITSYLWSQDGYSTSKLQYIKGKTSGADREVYLTVEPVLVSGKWTYPNVSAVISMDIYEKDDCINCEQRHNASQSIELGPLTPGKPKDFSFTGKAFATFAARGDITATGNVSLVPSEFDVGPGSLF